MKKSQFKEEENIFEIDKRDCFNYTKNRVPNKES